MNKLVRVDRKHHSKRKKKLTLNAAQKIKTKLLIYSISVSTMCLFHNISTRIRTLTRKIRDLFKKKTSKLFKTPGTFLFKFPNFQDKTFVKYVPGPELRSPLHVVKWILLQIMLYSTACITQWDTQS